MDQHPEPPALDAPTFAFSLDAATVPGAAFALTEAAPHRHDLFTGELMARFCEVLAETGTVSAACRAVGKCRDTAYAYRRRNPLFAAAWAAALSHARNRLADTLLERSIEGSVDYLYRDGELVGERRYIDNRLAYAMLRRLDKQAEADPQPVAAELARSRKPLPAKAAKNGPDWRLALTALRTGSEEDLCAALALFDDSADSDKSDNSDNPPTTFEAALPFPDDRVWEQGEDWWTNFPPPPEFAGEEHGRWNDPDYQRQCTPAEGALLTAARDDWLQDHRDEEERERSGFFDSLRAELGVRESPQAEDGSA